MTERIIDFWQREGRFTVGILAATIGLYILIQFGISTGTKIALWFVAVTSLFFLVVAAIIGSKVKEGEITLPKILGKDQETEATKETEVVSRTGHKLKRLMGIFVQVPENHILVLRNAWGSNPEGKPSKEDPKKKVYEGYYTKVEGWRIFLDKIWHDEVCLVNLFPWQRTPDSIEINTIDNLLPTINYRIKTWVAQNKIGGKEAIPNAAIKYAIRIGQNEEERIEAENQWAHVSLNTVTSKYSCSGMQDSEKPGLTELNRDELEELSKEANTIFDQEMKTFGIQGEIAIRNIRPPKSIETASATKRVATIRKETAKDEAEALSLKINMTQANPTLTLLAETALGVLGSFFEAKEQKPFPREEKKK